MKRKNEMRTVTQSSAARPESSRSPWTFLTNHAHVLLCLAKDPAARMRDVAVQVGVTERAVQRIVADLEEAGYLRRERTGRQNHYEIHSTLPLRHPVEREGQVSALIQIVLNAPS